MPDDVVGFGEQDAADLAEMIDEWRSLRNRQPTPSRGSGAGASRIGGYLAQTSSTITARSGTTLGSGTANIYAAAESGTGTWTVSDNDQAETVYNPTTAAIASGTYVQVFRDGVSGRMLAAPFSSAPAFSGAVATTSGVVATVNTVERTVPFPTVKWDTDSYLSSGDTTKFTAPVDGYYLAMAFIMWDQVHGTGFVGLRFYSDTSFGTTAFQDFHQESVAGTGGQFSRQISGMYHLSAGNYVQALIATYTGFAEGTSNGFGQMSLTKIGNA